MPDQAVKRWPLRVGFQIRNNAITALTLRFDIGRSYLELSPQMHPKAQTVEECTGTETTFMPDEFARQKGLDRGGMLVRRQVVNKNLNVSPPTLTI